MTHSRVLSEEERRKIVIGVLLVMLLAALDQTIVAPAVPTIGAALGDVTYLPWIVSAYFVTATAVTPLYGKLADIHGRRPVLYTAIGIFVLGSVICALAPSMATLIFGRAIQGLGGGGLIALAQTVIGDVVSPRERGRYMVYISTTWATASIAGPIVGGVFAQDLHWSLIFWLNLPLAAVGVAMTNSILQRLPRPNRSHRLDYLGAVLMVTATLALMFILTWAGTSYPWASLQILGLAAAFLILAAAFAWHVLHAPEPLIPLKVLRNPVIALATLSVFFAMGASVGLSVFIPLYLEMAHGIGSAYAGFALVGFLGMSVLGANTAGRVMMFKQRYKWVALAGVALAAAGMLVLAFGAATFSFFTVEVLLAVIGFGLGTQFPVTTVAVQNAAGPHDLGVATGMLAFLRSLGAALGVSVLGSIVLATGIVHNLGEIAGPHQIAAAGPAAPVSGHAFGWVFAATALGLALSFVALFLMKELPLRGGAPAAAEP